MFKTLAFSLLPSSFFPVPCSLVITTIFNAHLLIIIMDNYQTVVKKIVSSDGKTITEVKSVISASGDNQSNIVSVNISSGDSSNGSRQSSSMSYSGSSSFSQSGSISISVSSPDITEIVADSDSSSS